MVFSCLNTNFLRADCSAPPTCYSATTTVWFLFPPFVHNPHPCNAFQSYNLYFDLANSVCSYSLLERQCDPLNLFLLVVNMHLALVQQQNDIIFFHRDQLSGVMTEHHLIRQQLSLHLKGFLCQLSIVIAMGQSPMPLCQKQRNAPPFKFVSQNKDCHRTTM